jgi:hypothetical protein
MQWVECLSAGMQNQCRIGKSLSFQVITATGACAG